MPLLSDEELELVERLGLWWNDYCRLEEHHPNEMAESAHHIHVLQRSIMSRAAVRDNPERFTPWHSGLGMGTVVLNHRHALPGTWGPGATTASSEGPTPTTFHAHSYREYQIEHEDGKPSRYHRR